MLLRIDIGSPQQKIGVISFSIRRLILSKISILDSLKFSLLSLGLSTIPVLLADDKSNKILQGLIKDPFGVLDLPDGFSYSVISKEQELMDDGLLVPPNADAMTC